MSSLAEKVGRINAFAVLRVSLLLVVGTAILMPNDASADGDVTFTSSQIGANTVYTSFANALPETIAIPASLTGDLLGVTVTFSSGTLLSSFGSVARAVFALSKGGVAGEAGGSSVDDELSKLASALTTFDTPVGGWPWGNPYAFVTVVNGLPSGDSTSITATFMTVYPYAEDLEVTQIIPGGGSYTFWDPDNAFYIDGIKVAANSPVFDFAITEVGWTDPVPEPPTWMLLAVGLLLAGGHANSTRKRSATEIVCAR